MDIEALASRYEGEACLQRLIFIAETAAASPTAAAAAADPTIALHLAVALLQRHGNTRRYQQLVASWSSNSKLAPLLTKYMPWHNTTMEGADATSRHQLEQLSSQLHAAQAHLHKDAIRTAYLQLCDYYYSRAGCLSEALQAAQRSREYCTTRPHIVHVSLEHVIPCCVALGQWDVVRDHVRKLENTASGSDSSTTIHNNQHPQHPQQASQQEQQHVLNKIAMAAGLEALHSGDLPKATGFFRAVATSGTVTSWPKVLAPEEIALYVGILTLCFGSRHDMQSLADHADALELAPLLKECLVLFATRADYGQCWSRLEASVFPVLRLDVFMAPHLPKLESMLREKAILQYWSPFRRVALATMVQDLGASLVTPGKVASATDAAPITTLLQLLVKLIRSGKMVDTRINLQAQTLERDVLTTEERVLEETHAKLASVSDRVLNDSYSMMVRLACLEHGLLVGGSSTGRPKRTGTGGGDGGNANEAVDVASSDEESGDEPMMMDVADDMNPEDMY